MKQASFEQRHSALWTQLDQAFSTDRKQSKEATQALTDSGLDLPAAYRQLCQQLAIARTRQYSPGLVERLNHLTLRGHRFLYQSRPAPWQGIALFLTHGFPNALRREWRLFLFMSLLFYGSGAIFGWLVVQNPELIYSTLDYDQVQEFEEMYDPGQRLIGSTREANTNVLMFGYYIYNNIGIAFRTFAGGLLFGIGALFFILYNGVFFGAVTGHIVNVDYGETFFTFVIAHGAFELTAIVIAGVAGMRLGLSLLRPGNWSRLAALRQAAGNALQLMYGAFFLLLIAAFVEAFWSSNSSFEPGVKYGIGTFCWILVSLYLGLGGRDRRVKIDSVKTTP